MCCLANIFHKHTEVAVYGHSIEVFWSSIGSVFLQTQDRDNLKLEWIKQSLNELRSGRWVIPALKQIKSICELFYEV